ncbi:trans-3-hydroxy-L-proline dehydratase [Acidimangrovimonas pyrenivorans]|uniref:Proline racemase family protein n=1 Tax=Acidimangrovimonas pyrenivorans TaxID=2030798 RepID=A0ABV7AIF7_9RHOB
MQTDRVIHVVSAHAEGEVGNVITGGVAPPPGDTLWQQRDFLARDGSLRRLMLNEPRGGVFTHVDLLVPPRDPRAAMGFLIMEPEHTPPMSGSNTICVATVCLETGIVPIAGDETRFQLEAPAGLIEIVADTRGGRVNAIEIANVASFADRLGAALEVAGLGTLTVDTAYGGDSFVIADAAALGLALTPDEARDIATLGARITAAANAQLGFSHPREDWGHISFCQFAGPLRRDGATLSGANAVVIDPGKIDRSPCGTGCSARMAVLAARGEMKPGETYAARSLIGGRFDGRFTAAAPVGDRPAIAPRIRGRAWLTGTHQVMRDPADPWPEGYRLSDTWPILPQG